VIPCRHSWEQQEQIFQPFFTIRLMGLSGLAITRRLIEDQGIYLVEGRSVWGPTLIVRLPLLTPNAQMQEDEKGERDELKYLIVDDEPHLPYQLARFLRNEVLKCDCAADWSRIAGDPECLCGSVLLDLRLHD